MGTTKDGKQRHRGLPIYPRMRVDGVTVWDAVCRNRGRSTTKTFATRRDAQTFLLKRAVQGLMTNIAGRVAALLDAAAHRDGLTGLGNQLAFDEDLARRVQQARNRGSELAVICVDVDGLGSVNNTQGHPEGNRLLIRVGRALAEGFPAGATAYRWRGDEYAVLVPRMDAARAKDMMAGIVAQANIDVSWGVATFPADGEHINELLELADARLYEMKEAHHRALLE